MYVSHKKMSWAVEVKKPQEAQKARALRKMKAAKDAGEEHYDPTREKSIKRRSETRSEHLQLLRWTNPEVRVEDQY